MALRVQTLLHDARVTQEPAGELFIDRGAGIGQEHGIVGQAGARQGGSGRRHRRGRQSLLLLFAAEGSDAIILEGLQVAINGLILVLPGFEGLGLGNLSSVVRCGRTTLGQFLHAQSLLELGLGHQDVVQGGKGGGGRADREWKGRTPTKSAGPGLTKHQVLVGVLISTLQVTQGLCGHDSSGLRIFQMVVSILILMPVDSLGQGLVQLLFLLGLFGALFSEPSGQRQRRHGGAFLTPIFRRIGSRSKKQENISFILDDPRRQASFFGVTFLYYFSEFTVLIFRWFLNTSTKAKKVYSTGRARRRDETGGSTG